MITSFHGIGAYRGQRSPFALYRQTATALSGVEICAADRPIGAFGIVTTGSHIATFPWDVWSEIDPTGRRVSDHHAGITGATDQRQYEAYCRGVMLDELADRDADIRDISKYRRYRESWISATAIRAVWIKPWVSAETHRAAEIIARHYGVPLLFVSGTTRIWDVLDTHTLPITVVAA